MISTTPNYKSGSIHENIAADGSHIFKLGTKKLYKMKIFAATLNLIIYLPSSLLYYLKCKHCGYDKRVIRYGIKPGKIQLQRWFCCSCNRYSFTPLAGHEEKIKRLKQQRIDRQKEKTYNQLIKQATRAAYRALEGISCFYLGLV